MPEDQGAALHITYYTDPLDAWSWAFEPAWRRLRAEYGGAGAGQIAWRYCMTGLVADWQRFDDPLNAVSRPAQMGPYWLQVRHTTGMPLDELLWVEDPPASSYPACLAVKAAELQGPAAGEAYLRRVRQAGMLERRNVARPEVLVAIAKELAAAESTVEWDAERFCHDLDGDAPREAFREDLRDASYREIGRSPTLILRGAEGRATMVVGYRPYPALLEAVRYLVPGLAPISREPLNAVDYVRRGGDAPAAEVALALGLGQADAAAELEAAVVAGRLAARSAGRTTVYTPAT